MTTAQITAKAKRSGFESCNETLVSAVLVGTALRATTGAGVSTALWSLIEREASRGGS
jgi:hypothetical protein